MNIIIFAAFKTRTLDSKHQNTLGFVACYQNFIMYKVCYMHNVHNMYIVHCTVYSVQTTLYILQYVLSGIPYNVYCILYSVQ